MKIKVCVTRTFEVEVSDNSKIKEMFDTKKYFDEKLIEEAVKEVEAVTGIKAFSEEEVLNEENICAVCDAETNEPILEW